MAELLEPKTKNGNQEVVKKWCKNHVKMLFLWCTCPQQETQTISYSCFLLLNVANNESKARLRSCMF